MIYVNQHALNEAVLQALTLSSGDGHRGVDACAKQVIHRWPVYPDWQSVADIVFFPLEAA
jgi:hypothetical protein